MASIITSFEYDIFISYRQNDNKYDGWVTEFVNNLNKELEATLKDKVNVYFDANPHDGLLETHSVDHSLESKLKCLIFIPIFSKTYCDTMGFAWTHEFVAFIEKAKQDQFGLNIKLNSGNVSSRVLPVRIHDLDADDVKLAESYLGAIRSVDFIYRSPGVNRSLRPWDDDVIKNTKQPYYRDQINKVANAIDEILRGMKQAEKNKSNEKIPTAVVTESKTISLKSASPKDNIKISKSVTRLVAVAALLVALVTAGFFGTRWYLNEQKIDYARLVLLPAIQKLVDENFRPPWKAYETAVEAKKSIANDSSFIKLWKRLTLTIPSLETAPSGAEVFWKDYAQPNMEWISTGTTPIKDATFRRGYLRMEIRKPGYQTVEYSGPYSYKPLGDEIVNIKLD